MSTNLPGMQPGRNAMSRIAQAVRSRATSVREALESLDSEEESVHIGTAALLQSFDDEREPLAEEGEQLLAILSAGQHQQVQATQPEPAPLPVIVEQIVAPVASPVPPASTQESPINDQQSQATQPEPAPLQETPTPTQPITIVPQQWGRKVWIGALIGGIVAFLIAVNSRDWVADLADLTTGFGAWAIKAAWVVSIPVFGYYAVGFIISAALSRTRPVHNPRP